MSLAEDLAKSPESKPDVGEGEGGDEAKRMAGKDLREALAGDDDLAVYEAWEHLYNVCQSSGGDDDEGEGHKSDLVVAIGKAKPKKD